MSELTVFRAPTIEAEIRVPGDKSMSHRAVLLSAISNGTCVVRGFLPSQDCQSTVTAMRDFGIAIDQPEETVGGEILIRLTMQSIVAIPGL